MKKQFYITLIGLIVLFPFVTTAQTFLFESVPDDKPRFEWRLMKPFFEYEDLSILSGIYDFTVSFPLGPRWNIVGSLPFLLFNDDEGEEDSGIGNLYLGVQIHNENDSGSRYYGSVGVFVPTISEDKLWTIGLMGIFTNWYEAHKYVSDVFTFHGNVAYRYSKPNGPIVGVEIGPNVWINTEDVGDDVELFMHYGISAGYQFSQFAILTELVGLGMLTEEGEDLGDRFTHTLTVGVNWMSSVIRPGVFYQIYLDKDFRDVIDGVLGVKFDVVIP